VFKLGGVLPEGMVFPWEFGFVPSTLADDGDPLDILVLMDAPTSVGCLLTARLVGVIEAEQSAENGGKERNDRLIGIATHAYVHSEIESLSQLDSVIIGQIEHFFVSYNETRGKQFKPIGRHGPKRALKLVRSGMKAFQKRAGKNGA
jgi:inorganic pyrophosphatase